MAPQAGFTMRKTNFFKNFGNIMLYAILGTLIAINPKKRTAE